MDKIGLHFFVCFFFYEVWNFPINYFSRCKALGDFLISFLELDISKGCLGVIYKLLKKCLLAKLG